jgi:hypothetical protein
MEQYLRSQTQSRPVQQQSNELPELPQFEDEQVQKVVNAIEARNEKRFERLSQQQQQQHNQYAFNQEIRMINAALKDVRSERPDFAKVVSDQHISDFAKPFLADARYFGNVDWHKEFRLMAQTAEHPLLETENAQLKARIAQLEGSKDRQRKEQKDSLSKAPTFGQRAGKSEDSMGGTHAGDRVLNRWNKSNKARGKSKSPMPWNNFGAELIREMERSSQ